MVSISKYLKGFVALSLIVHVDCSEALFKKNARVRTYQAAKKFFKNGALIKSRAAGKATGSLTRSNRRARTLKMARGIRKHQGMLSAVHRNTAQLAQDLQRVESIIQDQRKIQEEDLQQKAHHTIKNKLNIKAHRIFHGFSTGGTNVAQHEFEKHTADIGWEGKEGHPKRSQLRGDLIVGKIPNAPIITTAGASDAAYQVTLGTPGYRAKLEMGAPFVVNALSTQYSDIQESTTFGDSSSSEKYAALLDHLGRVGAPDTLVATLQSFQGATQDTTGSNLYQGKFSVDVLTEIQGIPWVVTGTNPLGLLPTAWCEPFAPAGSRVAYSVNKTFKAGIYSDQNILLNGTTSATDFNGLSEYNATLNAGTMGRVSMNSPIPLDFGSALPSGTAVEGPKDMVQFWSLVVTKKDASRLEDIGRIAITHHYLLPHHVHDKLEDFLADLNKASSYKEHHHVVERFKMSAPKVLVEEIDRIMKGEF